MEKNETISFEEAEKLLSRPLAPPRKLEVIFGKAAMEAYDSVFSDPTLREMDYLCLTGAVDREEFGDYVAFLEEFRTLSRKLESLAHIMGRVLVLKAPYYLEQAFSAIHRGRTVRIDLSKSRLAEMITTIGEIRSADVVCSSARSYRNGFLQFLELDLLLRHFAALAVSAEGGPYQSAFYQFSVNFLQGARDNVRDTESFTFGTFLMYLTGMDAVRNWCPKSLGWNKETLALRKAEADRIAQEVFELSYLRAVSDQSVECEGFAIHLYAPRAEGRESIHRAYSVCGVGIQVPGSSKQLFGHVSRTTGEIRLVSGTLSSIEFMVGAELYAQIRVAVLSAIRDALRAKPDDYSWLPLKPLILPSRDKAAPLPSEVSAEDREEWARVARAEALLWSESERARAERDRQTLSVRSDASVQDVHALDEQVEAFRTLRAVASQDVIAALSRILGEPLRTRGSHTIFRGRTDRSYPIPNHGNAPVNIGILKGAFKVLGITALELKKAL